MANPTPLQKITSRIELQDSKSNPQEADGRYSVYTIKGESTLGMGYQYEVSFVSPVKLKIEEMVDTDIAIYFEDEKDKSQHKEIYAKVYEAKERDKVADEYLYSLQIVNPLHYLSLNQRYEIYQDKSAYDIIKEILGRYKALLHIELLSNIPPHTFIKREYTTQYKQSDFSFIQMLCQQEGITLKIREDSQHPYTITLSHINETYDKLTEELRCNYTQSKRFAVTHTVEDYYDFKTPSKEYLNESGKRPLSQSLKDNTKTSQLRHDILYMRHKDRLEEPREKDLKQSLKQQSLSNHSNSERIEGKSQSLYASIGYGGTLFDTKARKRIEAIMTKVSLEGFFPNALKAYVEDKEALNQYLFECHFEATPLKSIYIPPYAIIKPKIPSALTAIVSSGDKETQATPNTIDIDPYGRIRVLFHFDPNYPTSCYIRFANFSAGDGWGSQFIPRVNTEVIVNFLNGDPDRPVAIGSLYNGNNAIPKSLPQEKTQSYIKTQSMPGNKSQYNLLLFEDKAKEELVHIRAQKDYKLHALHDSTINIDHDQSEVVGRDESFSVGQDRTKSIGRDESSDIGQDRTQQVRRDENISIGKDQSLTIKHDQNIHIKNTQASKIDKDKFTYVGNHRVDKTHANHTVKIGGHHDKTIHGRFDIKAGERIKETTTLYQIDAGDMFVAKSNGGSIVIDGAGITFQGNVTIKGNVAIKGGAPEAVARWKTVANKGAEICWGCLLKEVMGA